MTPWLPVEPLEDDAYAQLRRDAIFTCQKWDPQVGDVNVIARSPLVIKAGAWAEVRRLAEDLARETLEAESALLDRPDLHGALGLPRSVRAALRRVEHVGPAAQCARLMRFDFHYTTEGWRISEANTDVPGGLNEASGFARLMAPHYPWTSTIGDPAAAYCHAMMASTGQAPVVALVHATAYSDDQQMMACLSHTLEHLGARVHMASPSHVIWRDGRAHLEAAWWRGPIDVIARFFPSEWLPLLPRATGWPTFFGGAVTALSNPATAILTQSKRFPLVWDALGLEMPTWRRLLPDTRDPRHVRWRGQRDWILKPALGRVGEGVGIADATDAAEWKKIQRSATWWPGHWVAQRRFDTTSIDATAPASFPCLGVYTVDGLVVGAYGRTAPRPLIDGRAADAAVLQAA